MKYGISISEQGHYKCANCGQSVNDINTFNYCSNCGAPLSPTAIANYIDSFDNERLLLINDLKSIAIENKTDRLSEILKIYNDEN